MGVEYCWKKAAEFARRAAEVTDERERQVFGPDEIQWAVAARTFKWLRKPTIGRSA